MILLADLLGATEGLTGAKLTRPCSSDWPALVTAACRHDLSPALAHAIRVHGFAGHVPGDAYDRLRRDVAAVAIGNYWRLRELDAIVERFDRERIPVTLLKGAALAPTLFRGRPERRIGDLDLLIRPADFGRVRQILTSRGYRLFAEATSVRFELRHESAQAFWRDEEHGSQVDVHWHVLNVPAFRERMDIEWFWRRTTPADIGGRRVRVLDHDAQLLHLALHFALHHRYEGLKWSYDIALLLASGAPFDWPALAAAAEAAALGDALRIALDRVHATWGVRVAREATAPARARVRRLVDQLRLAAGTAPTAGLDVVFQCSNRAGLGAKTRYLLGRFFPAAAFVREKYHVRHSSLVPLFYVWRAGVGVCKLTRSAVSAIGWFVRLRSVVRHA